MMTPSAAEATRRLSARPPALTGLSRKSRRWTKYMPIFFAHVVEAQKSLAAAKPDLIDRFLKAYFATIAFIKTHKVRCGRFRRLSHM
jgi:hypothetical protein